MLRLLVLFVRGTCRGVIMSAPMQERATCWPSAIVAQETYTISAWMLSGASPSVSILLLSKSLGAIVQLCASAKNNNNNKCVEALGSGLY